MQVGNKGEKTACTYISFFFCNNLNPYLATFKNLGSVGAEGQPYI